MAGSADPYGDAALIAQAQQAVQDAPAAAAAAQAAEEAAIAAAGGTDILAAQAQVEIQWWHAMGGRLGELVDEIAPMGGWNDQYYGLNRDVNTQIVPALPVGLMKTLSGSGARGLMVDVRPAVRVT